MKVPEGSGKLRSSSRLRFRKRTFYVKVPVPKVSWRSCEIGSEVPENSGKFRNSSQAEVPGSCGGFQKVPHQGSGRFLDALVRLKVPGSSGSGRFSSLFTVQGPGSGRFREVPELGTIWHHRAVQEAVKVNRPCRWGCQSLGLGILGNDSTRIYERYDFRKAAEFLGTNQNTVTIRSIFTLVGVRCLDYLTGYRSTW